MVSLGFTSSSLARYSYSSYPLSGKRNLAVEINRIIQNSPRATIGIAVKSMKYGDTLYSYNEQHLFVPASTMKLFTAEAALLYLGPEYKFPTRILTDASSIKNGVLNGNLYLVHSGDPSLTYDDIGALVSNLKAQKINTITGNIYIDTTAYDQENFGPGWIWGDTRYCYGAPINASIINHNCLSFRTATPVQVSHRNHHRHRRSQRVYTGSSVVTNILAYNKFVLQNLFKQVGIRVGGVITAGTAPAHLPQIASHESKPLHTLVSEMLKMSDNIIAGSLFKKLGELYTKRQGSWSNGSKAVSHILSQRANVNTSRISLLDGSGLSPENLATPSQMLQVLDFAYHNYDTSYELISALPIAGVDGTLKHRLQNIAWKVRAKTGTMSGVRSLAGYVISSNKEPLAFVIMVNGRDGAGWQYKEMEDKIVTALTRYAR